MDLDRELLDRARAAGVDLEEAERRALLCRAEYHTAIRRLHLSGGSLRDVAGALSLSHQRVQQIVSGAGGSWWTRVWRLRRVRPDAVCTWCGRPPSEVSKLVAGPKVYICDGCIGAAQAAAGTGRDPTGRFTRRSTPRGAWRCAFCSRRAGAGRSLLTARAGHVCSECLQVSAEICDLRSRGRA
jgi:hypothetical protein